MSGEIVVIYVYGILAGYIAGKTTQNRSDDNITVLIITIIAYLIIIITSGYTSKSASIATWHTICSISLSVLSFICYTTLANEKTHYRNLLIKKEAEYESLSKTIRDNVSAQRNENTL